MALKILYSNMLPLGIQDNQETIDEALIKLIEKYKRQEIKKTDIDIAISYWLKHSPKRLEQIIMQVGSS